MGLQVHHRGDVETVSTVDSGALEHRTDALNSGAPSAVGRRSKLQTFLFLFVVWTLPGLVYSVQIYQLGNRMETPTSFIAAMVHALPVWWIWIPVTPMVVRLARRFPIRSTGAFNEVLIHLGISLILAVLVAMLAGVWFSATAPFADRDRPWTQWTGDLMLSTTLQLYFWCYWLIVAAVQFLDHERRLREEELRTARLDALAAQSQMRMLVNQLRPHFLFNALNGLSTLILREDNRAAQSMLESLAALLRASLRLGESSMVPFREELELTAEYLRVENVRWGERLDVHIRVDPEVEDAHVPTFFLQPLLENAIRHGIATSQSRGSIKIEAERRGERLVVRIENDGTGLQPDWSRHSDGHVGLANTKRRLSLLYGEEHEFDLEEIGGGRVRLEIAIPFSKEKPQQRGEQRITATRPRDAT